VHFGRFDVFASTQSSAPALSARCVGGHRCAPIPFLSLLTSAHTDLPRLGTPQVVRLYVGLPSLEGSFVEVVDMVGPLPTDTEIVTRFSTNLDTDMRFYTDNNGLELQERISYDTHTRATISIHSAG